MKSVKQQNLDARSQDPTDESIGPGVNKGGLMTKGKKKK